ncbi:hypothetical protein SK128_003503 [Halocaridina rubra]|uniref:Uncharacterized protein n=1 Tax=Halocaridina rubra TaxID=373956 RepID=A0AAN8WVS3_HALRR
MALVFDKKKGSKCRKVQKYLQSKYETSQSKNNNPVRGDIASNSYQDRLHGHSAASSSSGYQNRLHTHSAASQLLQTFQAAALRPGTTLAIAHAHARGGPNTHAQALAHAGLYNFG